MRGSSALMIALGLGAAAGAVYLATRKESPKPSPKPLGPAPLDRSLTPEEFEAVRTALAVETDPRQLMAFAESLAPDYPLSVQALRARATALSIQHSITTSGSCCASCMNQGPCEGT